MDDHNRPKVGVPPKKEDNNHDRMAGNAAGTGCLQQILKDAENSYAKAYALNARLAKDKAANAAVLSYYGDGYEIGQTLADAYRETERLLATNIADIASSMATKASAAKAGAQAVVITAARLGLPAEQLEEIAAEAAKMAARVCELSVLVALVAAQAVALVGDLKRPG